MIIWSKAELQQKETGLQLWQRGDETSGASATCWRCFPVCGPTGWWSPTAAAPPSGNVPPAPNAPRHRTPTPLPAPSVCWRCTWAAGRSGQNGSQTATPGEEGDQQVKETKTEEGQTTPNTLKSNSLHVDILYVLFFCQPPSFKSI